jgi:hypothetical protein
MNDWVVLHKNSTPVTSSPARSLWLSPPDYPISFAPAAVSVDPVRG